MKIAELGSLTREELDKQLIALRKEQFGLRLQKGTGQLSQTHHMKVIRRNIARVKTAISAQRRQANG